MNTSALQSVFGVLIYNDGRCRMYRATRGVGNNCMYEQNDIFYVCYLPQVIGTLLNRNTLSDSVQSAVTSFVASCN